MRERPSSLCPSIHIECFAILSNLGTHHYSANVHVILPVSLYSCIWGPCPPYTAKVDAIHRSPLGFVLIKDSLPQVMTDAFSLLRRMNKSKQMPCTCTLPSSSYSSRLGNLAAQLRLVTISCCIVTRNKQINILNSNNPSTAGPKSEFLT